MSKFQVMVADPDVRMRRILQDALRQSSLGFEISAVTHSLNTALGRLEHSASDILLIDFHLVDAEKTEVLNDLLMTHPNLHVVAYHHAAEGKLLKPNQAVSAFQRFHFIPTGPDPEQIAPEILGFLTRFLNQTQGRILREKNGSPLGGTLSIRRPEPTGLPVEMIVIAVSTGGPNALMELVPELKVHGLPPVLIVQHMPPEFIDSLAERLNSKSGLDVATSRCGEVLVSGMCRIAAGNTHLEVEKSQSRIITRLTNGPPENSCKPAADVLFRSAAAILGSRVLGVVLTGMGRDGCAGSKAIVEAGGNVIVQDEKSSVVWGMPGSVVESGLADKILPISEIAREIMIRSGLRC